MPSSMTHTYFGIDVYNKLDKKCKNKIKTSMEYFKLFCQGSDPFMFYNFFIGKKAKEISQLQYIMHTDKTREFFIKTIKYIHNNKLNNNSAIMAYLYGYICHYYLDLYTHPFIYYKGGKFNKKDKNTYKYNGIHQRIEYAIDIYFIEKREKIKANEFKIYKEIYDVHNLNLDLKNIIDATIQDVYDINEASKIYEDCIKYMRAFFRLASYDRYGVKLKVYRIIDRLTPNSIIKIQELSYSNKYKNINDYLNLDNKIWYCPWDKTKSYKSSFLDLYNRALDKSVKTIAEVTKMLESEQLNNDKLERLFQDLSYATGLKCDEKVIYKYFEF